MIKRSKLSSLLLPLLVAGHVYGGAPLSSVQRVTNLPIVPGQFILEVDTIANIPTKRSFTRPLDAVYALLKERAVVYDVTKEFEASGLFVGATVIVNSVQDVVAISNTPGVIAIRPVVRISSPKPTLSRVATGLNDPTLPSNSESTHILTGVDKLHAQGIIGTGIKIGIIDTGIDYTHPSLGGGMGPGFKVTGGFDFVGDAYTGENNAVPDSDPMDQCNGHGTHVAGIIGANPGNEYGVSGVAYGAKISSYRVFGCTGSATDDVIVEALLRAVSDGQDIINLSLGEPNSWTESTLSVVANRIATTGKIVTISAGNDGMSGSWYTSSPATAINAIAVASVDNTVIPLQNATVNGVTHAPITYFKATPLNISGNLRIYATSTDTTVVDDACNALPANTPNLSQFLVVVRRGGCSFIQKLTNVAAKGGVNTFIYDNGSGFVPIDAGTFSAVLIQAADGEYLVQQFAANAPITISFPQVGGAFNLPDPNGGLISSFSSYGPSNDFFFKPAVAAPGGNILSTFPTALGSFALLSGTSMASPYVAGSSALLLSVKGKSQAVTSTARTLFETTAKAVSSSKTDGDPLQTLTQQGAGLINVFNAINAKTIISTGELILNDTANFKPVQSFTVKNVGNTIQTFKLKHVPAGTALTIQPGTIHPENGPVPLSARSASVLIVPSIFILLPGQTLLVVATFSLPNNLDASTFPVFSGFIQIDESTTSQSYHVSYVGLAGSLKKKQVVDNTDYFYGVPLPAVLDSVGDIQADPTDYTFVGDDFPTLLWRLTFGTRALRVDLVDAAINFNPTIHSRGLLGLLPLFSFPSPSGGGTFSQVKVVGPLMEVDYVPRNDEGENASNTFALDNPIFANGTTIPNGRYRFLVRALKVTGNPINEGDYESWLSPIIGVQV